MNSKRHIQIADFGLCGFADSTRNDDTTERGNTRWMAPELLDPEVMGYHMFKRTLESDIYSFAMVCIEVRVSWLSNMSPG
jgi:serine/threonine protein kinase